MEENRKRYIGLDVHKHYLIALGVDADLNVVLPARRVVLFRLERWMKKNLTKTLILCCSVCLAIARLRYNHNTPLKRWAKLLSVWFVFLFTTTFYP